MISCCYGRVDSPNTKVLHETKILNCALTNGHIFWNVKPTWMCLKPNVFLMVSRGDSAGCMMKTQNLSSLSLKAFLMSRGGKSNITSWCRVSKNPNRLLQIVHFSDFYSVYILLFIYSPLSKPEMNQGLYPIKIQRFSSYHCRCHSNKIYSIKRLV